MSYTKGLWSQGRTLLTNATIRYTKEEWELNESIEKRTIITHFLESDAGKSRIPIANCFSEEDAERIVACVNACINITTEALEAGIVEAGIDAMKSVHRNGKPLFADLIPELKTFVGIKIWEDDDGKA